MFYNSVTPFLKEALEKIMMLEEFNSFRLVGGTALSLQLGHRKSIDIDLFSDSDYGTIDFNSLEKVLRENFKIVDGGQNVIPAMGNTIFTLNLPYKKMWHNADISLVYRQFIAVLPKYNRYKSCFIGN